MHGVVVKKNGETVEVSIGEDEKEPVFCVTDLLPHLAARQNERPLKDGLKGEELNIVVGSLPFQDEEVKEPVKLMALSLLNEKYGITEKDFFRAEIEMVPAVKARDVGFDTSMIGAYGQDDRVCAYTALTGPSATSLLPIGVNRVEGEFEKDDIVRIVAPDGEPIGVGRVACSSAKARQTMGQKGGRPVVHYDYLYLD